MKISKFVRLIVILVFSVYCVFLAYVLFFNLRFTHLSYINHIKRSVNLIPFKTIAEYISRIKNDSINLSTFIENVFGNLVLFLPMGFMLPCLSDKFRRFSKVFLTSLIMILIIEATQLFTTLGSFDIDDIIFNMFGCCVGYGIYSLKLTKNLLARFRIISKTK